MSDSERQELMQALIAEIRIYEEPLPGGQWDQGHQIPAPDHRRRYSINFGQVGWRRDRMPPGPLKEGLHPGALRLRFRTENNRIRAGAGILLRRPDAAVHVKGPGGPFACIRADPPEKEKPWNKWKKRRA